VSEWVELVNGMPMPPLDQRVLVYTGKAKKPAIWSGYRHVYPNGHRTWAVSEDAEFGISAQTVTHWRELPAPPTTESAGQPDV